MKKLIVGALSLGLMAFSVVSCGGGASSEADIAKKAEEKLKTEEATLMEEATKKCDELVATKKDSIAQAMAEQTEGEGEAEQ